MNTSRQIAITPQTSLEIEEMCHVLQDIMQRHPDTELELSVIVERLSEMFDL